MVDFRNIVDNLQDWGFFDIVLPFLLVYVVVFAVLEKSKIFKVSGDGDNSHVKNVHAVISLVFGLFVVASIQTVRYIQDLILNIALVIIFILVTLILLAFIFGEKYMDLFFEDGNIKRWAVWGVAFVIFLIAFLILANIMGWFDWLGDLLDDAGDSDTVITIIVVAIIGGILYLVTRDSSGRNNGGGSSNSSSE